MTAAAKSSYAQILKSSAQIGAVSVLEIGLGVARVKAMALLLGPAGVGLMGLFGSIADVAQTVAGMGVDSSGVREVAHAVGSGDRAQLARTVAALRRICLVLGVVGTALVAVLAYPIAVATFGSAEHAPWVVFLSLTIFFRQFSNGRVAVLQGTRSIADLARVKAVGAAAATVATISLVFAFGEAGVAPSIVSGAALLALVAWWFPREPDLPRQEIGPRTSASEIALLLKLGLAFMATGMITVGVAYVVRVIVMRQLGIEAAGLYLSAWTIGGLYVGIILQAMGADFYPRLTSTIDDSEQSVRIVNEQVLISLLLAGPGVLATLTLAPLVMGLFYSPEFEAAVPTLRWLCLGMSLRVITWPLGFIVIARGLQRLFVWIDVACAAVHLALAWLLVRWVGLEGAGAAFFGLYVFHALIMVPIARSVIGFRWSSANRRLGLAFIPSIAVVFAGFYVLPSLWATALGAIAVAASGVASLLVLARLIDRESLPGPVRRLMDLARRLLVRR